MKRWFGGIIAIFLFLFHNVNGQTTPTFDSLKARYNAVATDSQKAELASKISSEALKVSFDSMMHYAKKTIHFAQKSERSSFEAEGYVLKGSAHYFMGSHDSAFSNYIRALEIFKSINSKRGQARVLNEIGVLHRKQGDLEKAADILSEALQLSQKQNDKPQIANGMNNLGVVYKMQGNYKKAMELFRESAHIKRELNDINGLTYNLNNMGITHAEQENFDSALYYFNKTLNIRKELQDKQGIAIAYCNLGEMYNMMGRYDSAKTNLFAALRILGEVDFKDFRKHIYMLLSEIFEREGDNGQALAYYRKYTALKDSIFNETKSKQILELETKYETAEKDRQIAEQKLTVKRRNQMLYALGGGLGVLLLVSFLVYRNQRQRQQHLKNEALLKEELAKKEMQERVKNERLRISRDLHDNIGAELTLISSALDSRAYQSESEREKEWYNEISNYSRSAMTQLRETIWAIKTNGMSTEDFATKVREFTQKIVQMAQVNIIVKNEVSPDIILSPTQVINLYRVSQEALQNAVKYANTKKVCWEMKLEREDLVIAIKDEGIGFDEEKISLGYGLENMRERLNEIGGTLKLQTREGDGTTVIARIPIAQST